MPLGAAVGPIVIGFAGDGRLEGMGKALDWARAEGATGGPMSPAAAAVDDDEDDVAVVDGDCCGPSEVGGAAPKSGLRRASRCALSAAKDDAEAMVYHG